MATPSDFTTRARSEMFAIFQQYQSISRRVADLADEVAALGGAAGIYGAGGVNFPAQGDDFDYADMTAAFLALAALVPNPTAAQKNAIIKARRE